MILVTGAGGKTGRAVVEAIAARGCAVRALVHRPEQIQELLDLGATEASAGDMTAPAVLDEACTGVNTVYHICPNMHPAEVALAQALLDAAQRRGVARLIYHSVLHPHVEEMPHHWHKMRVEELIFKTGLAYTILQPAAYMQNVLTGWQAVVEQGVYRVPYAAETRLGMVDLPDVAQAAATVLAEDGHHGAIYELAGSEILSQQEVANRLAQELGRPVAVEVMDRRQWAENARRAELSPYAVDALLRMFVYYERYGFWGNPTVLTALLGRAPATFADFVRRVTAGTG